MVNSTTTSDLHLCLGEQATCYRPTPNPTHDPVLSTKATAGGDFLDICYITIFAIVAAYVLHAMTLSFKSTDMDLREIRNEDVEGYDENLYWEKMTRKYEARFGRKLRKELGPTTATNMSDTQYPAERLGN
ncbi:hypothetical protein DL95DRAFT_400069 [Leptodontidium sp. 2 PMI_412]|nr:hypothetical protein DL95DRAFT_400069 [Leptodontidium sp. 2 PMI_412]